MTDTQAPERIWAYSQTGCEGIQGQWRPIDMSRLYGPMVEYERRDLADARAAAAAQAMREAAAKVPDSMIVCYLDGSTGAGEDIAQEIRALPLPDTDALDRLIAERVRDAVEAEREACATILAEMALAYDKADDQGRPVALMVARNAIAARGSKEGRDD